MEEVMAIALDLDGTLLNSAKEVSPRNLDILLKCNARGIHIIIATARPPRSVKNFLPQELLEISSMIYYNGALIQNPKLDLHDHLFISSDMVKQVYDFIKLINDQCYVCFEIDDQLYSDRLLDRAQLKVFGIPDYFPIPSMLINIENICATKILLPNFDIYKILKDNFGEKLNMICTDRGELIQIMNRYASKEEGLKKVLNLINVSPDKTVAFGDDSNDLGMLKMCGFPVAMGNAIDELKKCAKIITETNDQDGVATMLEKFYQEANL